jgi:hypothetical protein
MSVLLIVCLGLAVSNACAAYTTPSKVPIQGRLTNVSTGAALSGVYVFTFRVYNASTGGMKLWEENQSLTVDSGGLWSTYLGNNTPLDFSFSEDMYIEIEINHDNDPLPRVQLATVPYSKRTDIAANLSCVDCIGGAEINESTLSGVNAAQLDGQASGYFLNISSSYGGDVSGTYDSIKVNASKIDTGTLNRSFIEDAYLLNAGDNAFGNYSFDSDTLYVDSTNHRIGIGMNTPTYKLEVLGGVNATGNLTTPLVCLNGDCRSAWPTGSGISSAGGWANTSSETYSSLDVNLSNKFFFNSSSGYVGIGTAGPTTGKLVLASGGASSVGMALERTTATTAGDLGVLDFYNGATRVAQIGTASDGGVNDSGRIFLWTKPTGGSLTSRMMIDSNGNVGIGTASPSAKLDVAGNFEVDGSDFFVNSTSGNVGIGTSGPGAPLEISSTVGSQIIRSTTGTNTVYSKYINTGGNLYVGIDRSTGGSLATGTLPYAAVISHEGDYPMQFSTNNSVKMTILSAGNVGIGTTGPAGKLEVLESTSANAEAYITARGGNSLISQLVFRTKNGVGTSNGGSIGSDGSVSGLALSGLTGIGGTNTHMFIQSSGNIGIGTTSPSSKLDVAGNFEVDGSDFFVNSTSGNVGIGTTNPTATLSVTGNILAQSTHYPLPNFKDQVYYTTIAAPNYGETSWNVLSSLPSEFAAAHGKVIVMYKGSEGDTYSLSALTLTQPGYASVYGRGYYMCVFDWNGSAWVKNGDWQIVGYNPPSAGFGLTFPDAIGGVTKAATYSTYVDDINGLVIPYSLWMYAGGFNSIDVNPQTLILKTNLIERMRITSDGNVGIGTTTPGTYKLNIAGTGYLGASAWVYSSDRRLKQNISYLDGSCDLDKIMLLKPARFDYISGEKNQLGFIAQDVQNAIPEAVVADAETGMLGLKTEFMIPYLVKGMQEQQGVIQDQQGAIQDQQKQMDNLKSEKDSEIKELKAENDEIKRENEALKALVCLDHPDAEVCMGVSGI